MTTSTDAIIEQADEPPTQRRTGGAAAIVATGVLASRLFGIVRQSLMASFLGTSIAADAFTASFKITNFLQNLFGEGALSASFIPVYARLLEERRDEEAGRVAGAVAALLALTVSVIVLIGVILTPQLIPLIAWGFKDAARRDLTIKLTRILFPGAGIFVLSAWCLGVLNSHRRFLLPYFAPVLWNVVMIAALAWGGPRSKGVTELAVLLAWASVIGAAAQFLIQLPLALRLARHLRLSLGVESANVKLVVKNFVPAFVSRGVVQISSYIDTLISTVLPQGMAATFYYAAAVVVLPVSLFGMSISAAELPEMSRTIGSESDILSGLRTRLDRGLRHIAFFVVPSAAAFLAFGDVIARVLFEYKRFTAQDTLYSWGILAGAAVGLLATTMGRLYSSTYYALQDTRTPLRFAMIRVALTSVLGYLCALPLPRWLGIDPHWGAAGLTASAGIAGWVEFSLLRSRLNARIGQTGAPAQFVLTLWICAAIAVAVGWGTRILVEGRNHLLGGLAVLAVYGVAYLGATMIAGVPEARSLPGRIKRRR